MSVTSKLGFADKMYINSCTMFLRKRLWVRNGFHTSNRLLEYFNDKRNCRGGCTLKVHLLGSSMKQAIHDVKRLLSTILCFDIFSKFLRNICMEICFLVTFLLRKNKTTSLHKSQHAIAFW